MQLRNGYTYLSTAFDIQKALEAAIELDDSRHQAAGEDAGDLTDTEAITEGLRNMQTPTASLAGTKRRRQGEDSTRPTLKAIPPSTSPSTSSTLPTDTPSTTTSGPTPPLPTHDSKSPPTSFDTSVSSASCVAAVSDDSATSKPNRRHLQRKHKRREAKLALPRSEQGPSLKKLDKLYGAVQEKTTDFSSDAQDHTRCGYWGRPTPEHHPTTEEDLHHLREVLKYDYIKWNGWLPKAVTDRAGRVTVMLAGRPADQTWQGSCHRVYRLFRERGDRLMIHPKYTHHIRGNFPAINVGVTHGKGTKAPSTVNHADHVKDIVYGILEDSDMRRLARFQETAFATWAPKLHGFYKDYMDQLWEEPKVFEELEEELRERELRRQRLDIRRNFPGALFPSIALNFGPHVWTTRHRDCKNIPFGWCAITALGNFDSEKGGHLVLPDLELIIEFPSGSTILIPSATLVHANVPVQDGETRVSFTQFAAGDLFRFIDCGYRTERQLQQDDPKEYERVMKLKRDRWWNGLELWSTLDELALDTITERYRDYVEP